jgi:RNA polymerase sigma-70 factor (ECF subfamily)
MQLAEEMVQQVFYRIWEKKEQFGVHTSAKAFLYRAVHNECLNYLKQEKHRIGHRNYLLHANKHSFMSLRIGRFPLSDTRHLRKILRSAGRLSDTCGMR